MKHPASWLIATMVAATLLGGCGDLAEPSQPVPASPAAVKVTTKQQTPGVPDETLKVEVLPPSPGPEDLLCRVQCDPRKVMAEILSDKEYCGMRISDLIRDGILKPGMTDAQIRRRIQNEAKRVLGKDFCKGKTLHEWVPVDDPDMVWCYALDPDDHRCFRLQLHQETRNRGGVYEVGCTVRRLSVLPPTRPVLDPPMRPSLPGVTGPGLVDNPDVVSPVLDPPPRVRRPSRIRIDTPDVPDVLDCVGVGLSMCHEWRVAGDDDRGLGGQLQCAVFEICRAVVPYPYTLNETHRAHDRYCDLGDVMTHELNQQVLISNCTMSPPAVIAKYDLSDELMGRIRANYREGGAVSAGLLDLLRRRGLSEAEIVELLAYLDCGKPKHHWRSDGF